MTGVILALSSIFIFPAALLPVIDNKNLSLICLVCGIGCIATNYLVRNEMFIGIVHSPDTTHSFVVLLYLYHENGNKLKEFPNEVKVILNLLSIFMVQI